MLYVVVVVVSHIQHIVCQPEKTTLHGGQSSSWSAEQGEKKKKKSGRISNTIHRRSHPHFDVARYF